LIKISQRKDIKVNIINHNILDKILTSTGANIPINPNDKNIRVGI